MFHQGTDTSSHYQIFEIVSSTKQSDEFSNLLVKLFWNNRTSIPKDGKSIQFTVDNNIDKFRSY